MLLSLACFCLIANSSGAQTATEPETLVDPTNVNNICQLFSEPTEIEAQIFEAPPPVRRLSARERTPLALTITEREFYQSLGLIKEQDGIYTCMAVAPNNSRRRFTLFKVYKLEDVIVISSFLDAGVFLPRQQEAITQLFLAMIRFYTDLPPQYYPRIASYFREFYLLIADGRIQPSSTRVYPVDEPEATVILYHPLQGHLKGTGLSLNIPRD